MLKRIVPVMLAMAIISCNDKPKKQTTAGETTAIAKDMHTQSNADSIELKHLDLDIKVDFEQHLISGRASWNINNPHKLAMLALDAYRLTVDSVVVDGSKVQHTWGTAVTHLGTALQIPVQDGSKRVDIYYKSDPGAKALQWMTPQQTSGKKHPFLYTQSESIYARSWIPCPDGPGIRFTYTARVQVPTDLMALMSATNPQQKNDSGIYHFEMDMPIPAYLMALGVGDLQFKAIDERTGVYADPVMLDKAHNEFAEVGKMVKTAEDMYGPYRWGRYDILVLPSGFPIGGMENPKLTFCTPTIISGDRSLTNLIAHELAHNWSGNLVTNATWNDFWLNEGFTVYFERRLTEKMTDGGYADMLWELGYQDLEKTIAGLEADSLLKDTHLKINLAGRDPDDGLTDIAYEKGALFLKHIENTVGREKMDAFLRKYFDEHAFKTITTEQFIAYLNDNLIKGDKDLAAKINVDGWVYAEKVPADAPRKVAERFKAVDAEREKFVAGTAAAQLNTANWTTYEWLHFLRKLPKPLSIEQMTALDKQFKFTTSGNSEIAAQWYVMAIAANYKAAYPAMQQFLATVGRRKFLEPIYEEMMTTGKVQMAQELYTKYRNNYHPLAHMTFDKMILKQQEKS
jgi:leukotriene-A4 hydrolase